MPWCPKCRNEYKEGYTFCSDCNLPLVENIEKASYIQICSGERNAVERLSKFLFYNKIDNEMVENQDGTKAIYVNPKTETKSRLAAKVFFAEEEKRRVIQESIEETNALNDEFDEIVNGPKQEEDGPKFGSFDAFLASFDEQTEPEGSEGTEENSEEASDEENDVWSKLMSFKKKTDEQDDDGETESLADFFARTAHEADALEKPAVDETPIFDEEDDDDEPDLSLLLASDKTTKEYVNTSERAEDFKSSGYVLLSVGIIGFVAMCLINLGIIKIEFSNMLLMNLMMYALFIFFIVFGVYSLKGAGKLADQAQKEATHIDEINTWIKENLNAKDMDSLLGIAEDSEDELDYFKRSDYLKKVIKKQFPDLPDSGVDRLTDDAYQMLFEEEEE